MEETKKRPNSGKANKARDIQDEKRTIFVGNLDKDTKKEVTFFIVEFSFSSTKF